jgi:hypothetical protein
MPRRITLLIAVAVLAAPAASSMQTPAAWSVNAAVAESCSCGVTCPCNFGNPTQAPCNGSRLIQINAGHHGGVNLAGVSFVVTFRMGQWAKIYVDETISDPQMKALEGLLPVAFGGFHKTMRSLQRVPLTVERTGETVRFSVPESTVAIERVRGLGGKPITVDGLPSPAFIGYTQYRSTTHTHKSADAEFSYTGTNGFTSTMTVSSQP